MGASVGGGTRTFMGGGNLGIGGRGGIPGSILGKWYDGVGCRGGSDSWPRDGGVGDGTVGWDG